MSLGLFDFTWFTGSTVVYLASSLFFFFLPGAGVFCGLTGCLLVCVAVGLVYLHPSVVFMCM